MSKETTESEKVATISRFGFDKPEPYIVHIYGLDDIYEFDSWLGAVAHATAWNTETVEYVTRRIAEEGGEPPHLTKSWATPYTREHALQAGII